MEFDEENEKDAINDNIDDAAIEESIARVLTAVGALALMGRLDD